MWIPRQTDLAMGSPHHAGYPTQLYCSGQHVLRPRSTLFSCNASKGGTPREHFKGGATGNTRPARSKGGAARRAHDKNSKQELELLPRCARSYALVCDRRTDEAILKQLTSRRYPVEMINAVLNEETGELMEYRHIMKNPKYRQLYATSYSKDLGRLA